MPINFTLLAAVSVQAARLALGEQAGLLTEQDQINKCRELEAEARAFASSERTEKREDYLRTADGWASLATELERDYCLLDHPSSSHRR